MNNGKLASLVLASGLFLAAQSAQAAQCSDEQIAHNRSLIEALAAADQETSEGLQAVANLMAPDYIQRNPLIVDDYQGREGYLRAAQRLVDMGESPNYQKPVLIIADCEYVSAMLKFVRKDPENPAVSYDSYWFDIWRVKDGLLAEHWDGAIRGVDYQWDEVIKNTRK